MPIGLSLLAPAHIARLSERVNFHAAFAVFVHQPTGDRAASSSCMVKMSLLAGSSPAGGVGNGACRLRSSCSIASRRELLLKELFAIIIQGSIFELKTFCFRIVELIGNFRRKVLCRFRLLASELQLGSEFGYVLTMIFEKFVTQVLCITGGVQLHLDFRLSALHLGTE